ncbi:chlP, partial [Symbiodinium sp. CCMP2456]
MAAFVAVPSSVTSTALRGSLQHVPQAPPSPAPAASFSVKGALGVAAVGAAVAAGTRRKHRSALAGAATVTKLSKTRSLADAKVVVCAGAMLPEGRKLRVAVIGGGPAGASTADALAQEGIETYLIERKLDNCKPCGGAIPLCMIEEFDLPKDIVDRQVRKMTMISPTNKEVQIGQTLKDDEFIGMVRREVLDDFLRQRAKTNGATLINGLFMGMTIPQSKEESYVLTYNDFGEAEGSARKGEKKTLEVD